MTEWRTRAEDPDKSKIIVFYHANGGFDHTPFYQVGKWCEYEIEGSCWEEDMGEYAIEDSWTHWMELPEAPNE